MSAVTHVMMSATTSSRHSVAHETESATPTKIESKTTKPEPETWSETTANHVIHAYVKAETAPLHTYTNAILGTLDLKHNPTILDKPDFNSPTENALRHRALMSARRWMWCELPPTTRWYVCPDFQFNEERRSSIRVPWSALQPPTNVYLDDIILFTHDRKTFTCIEGNHRITRWKQEGSKPQTARVFIGETPDLCIWHDGTAESRDELKQGKTVSRFVAGYSAYDPYLNERGVVANTWQDSSLPWLMQDVKDETHMIPDYPAKMEPVLNGMIMYLLSDDANFPHVTATTNDEKDPEQTELHLKIETCLKRAMTVCKAILKNREHRKLLQKASEQEQQSKP